jgi:putative endonuclease
MTFFYVIARSAATWRSHLNDVIARSAATWRSHLPMDNQYFVYILTNQINSVLYVGVTNDLIRRIYEHKMKLAQGFTNKYNADKLVYYEIFTEADEAISREKQLKAGKRRAKIDLILGMNPDWEDLYEKLV